MWNNKKEWIILLDTYLSDKNNKNISQENIIKYYDYFYKIEYCNNYVSDKQIT